MEDIWINIKNNKLLKWLNFLVYLKFLLNIIVDMCDLYILVFMYLFYLFSIYWGVFRYVVLLLGFWKDINVFNVVFVFWKFKF